MEVHPELAQKALVGGRGPAIIATGWSLCGITTCLLILRIYTYVHITKTRSGGGWALSWACFAWVSPSTIHTSHPFHTDSIQQLLTTITESTAVVAVHNGVGNHLLIIAAHNRLKQYLLFTWITTTLFCIAITVGRIAVASFLLAVQARTHQKLRYALWFVAVSNVIVLVPEVFLTWFACDPPDALWDLLRQSHCEHLTHQVKYSYFFGGE